MRTPLISAVFAAAVSITSMFGAGSAIAEPWKLDKSHTSVTFSVEHLGFSLTQGMFREFDANIDFDPDNIESASVEFSIVAESVDTNWPARDNHVRSKDFLDAANHKNLTFKSTKVRLTGSDTAEVTGDFTMRGETHEEVFTAKLKRIGPSPFNPSQTVAGFVIEGELDRTKYGVAYGAPAIGGVVPFRIDMEISPAN
ncbi:MAG: YceI family protein [Pikeienuella sp.]